MNFYNRKKKSEGGSRGSENKGGKLSGLTFFPLSERHRQRLGLFIYFLAFCFFFFHSTTQITWMAKRAEDARGGGQTQKADTSFLPDILIGLSTIPSRLRPSSIFHHPSTNSAPPPDLLHQTPSSRPPPTLIRLSDQWEWVFFLFVVIFLGFFFLSLYPNTLDEALCGGSRG